MSDYFDYPQDARDTRQPTSPHLRFLPDDTCDDCGHQVSQHSSEGGVGCLHDGPIGGWHDDEPCARWACWCVEACSCLRPGTSQADQ